MRHFFSSFPVVFAASVFSIGLQATPAQAITTWNWSFTTDISGQYASGTFTTTDVIPTAFTTYSILDIDGTYSRGGSTYNIEGLSDYMDAENEFQWDGTVLSPIISTTYGISFLTSGNNVNLYRLTSSGFDPVKYTATEFGGSDGDIVSSSLTPSLTPVPGPLPVFGAAAAYSWSRRMRRRIAAKA